MGRAPCCDKANVKKGPWSPEEDATLKAYIEQHGTGGNWIALPQKIGLKRCGKSCRLRWLNYLRPNIKHGGFSEEEDNIICNLYISIGSRWSVIAAQLPGRTDNDIKNYWNTRLKKKLLGKRKQSNNNNTNPLSPNSSNSEDPKEALSNSAIERLQLHMQLQGLQNPLSFYTHPQLWPKLHPMQEKIIQTLQYSLNNHHQNSNLANNSCSKSTADFFQPQPTISLPQDYKSDHQGSGINEGQGFEEVDEFLNNKTVESFIPQTDQIAEFDCFKEISGSKSSFTNWWSNNDFDMKSASSSNSWDSSSVLRSEFMCQDYDLGYNL